jgi:hypothetical protein
MAVGQRFSMSLAKFHRNAHINCMATAPSVRKNKSVGSAKKIARSAMTGQFVLAPATKGGTVTIAKARSAANTVHSSTK